MKLKDTTNVCCDFNNFKCLYAANDADNCKMKHKRLKVKRNNHLHCLPVETVPH